MAKDKKSFLLYCDLIHTVKKLSDEQAGKLLKHILSYVNDENPITDDIILDLVFEPIKQSLKRDLKKYENICNRNRKNGLNGGRPSNPDEPKEPSGLITNPNNPSKPDIDNDKDKGKDKDKKPIEPTWKTNFAIYLDELNDATEKICNDTKWIAEQEKLNPNVDIVATIRKGVAVYWGVETEGYANKKKAGGKDIIWKTTFAKNMDKNKVYKPFKKVADTTGIIFNGGEKKSEEWREI